MCGAVNCTAAHVAGIKYYIYNYINIILSIFPCGHLRVAEEEQAQDGVGSEEVNKGAAQAPAGQRQHGEPGHH